jgi:hypothetical protein
VAAPARKANVRGQKFSSPWVSIVVTRMLAIHASQARAHPADGHALMRCRDRADLPGVGVTGVAVAKVRKGIAVP